MGGVRGEVGSTDKSYDLSSSPPAHTTHHRLWIGNAAYIVYVTSLTISSVWSRRAGNWRESRMTKNLCFYSGP